MTRFGCIGCFSIIAVIALIAVVFLGGIALSTNIFEVPDLPRQDFSQEDGRRFQQKVAEIMLREAKISSRKDPIVVSQRELNAFLQRHLLESEKIRVSPMVVNFKRGKIEVKGNLMAGGTSTATVNAGGTIVVTGTTTTTSTGAAVTVTMTPAFSTATGTITWSCIGTPSKYLPATCR